MIETRQLVYRRIDPDADADVAYEHYLQASIASYGSEVVRVSRAEYLKWLRDRVDEFPDGNVLVLRDNEPVGQLELQAPYGSPDGYINLYTVAGPHRGQGIGRAMHEYVERYFRSWESERIDLHVATRNVAATRFYRRLGYEVIGREGWVYRMRRELVPNP